MEEPGCDRSHPGSGVPVSDGLLAGSARWDDLAYRIGGSTLAVVPLDGRLARRQDQGPGKDAGHGQEEKHGVDGEHRVACDRAGGAVKRANPTRRPMAALDRRRSELAIDMKTSDPKGR